MILQLCGSYVLFSDVQQPDSDCSTYECLWKGAEPQEGSALASLKNSSSLSRFVSEAETSHRM